MFTTEPAKVATSLGFAAVFSTPLFGIQISDIAIGTLFAIVGVLGRGMVEMQKTLERGDKVKIARSLGWMACGIVGAPFVTILYLALISSVHWPIDAFAVMALLLLGFTGPKGAALLVDTVGTFFRSRGVPGNFSPGPKNGDEK